MINKRILIVDDEPDITSSLKIGLEYNEDNEFKVDTFNDSIEALLNYKTGHYDLLLLDIKMPEMDGFDLYHEIKKMDDNVKIFFLTASEMYYENFRTKQYCELDKNMFLRKPISIYYLSKRIKEELQK
jgi:DNA-binding response OmpR family regulator